MKNNLPEFKFRADGFAIRDTLREAISWVSLPSPGDFERVYKKLRAAVRCDVAGRRPEEVALFSSLRPDKSVAVSRERIPEPAIEQVTKAFMETTIREPADIALLFRRIHAAVGMMPFGDVFITPEVLDQVPALAVYSVLIRHRADHAEPWGSSDGVKGPGPAEGMLHAAISVEGSAEGTWPKIMVITDSARDRTVISLYDQPRPQLNRGATR